MYTEKLLVFKLDCDEEKIIIWMIFRGERGLLRHFNLWERRGFSRLASVLNKQTAANSVLQSSSKALHFCWFLNLDLNGKSTIATTPNDLLNINNIINTANI